MSTKMTTSKHGYTLADSQSLALVQSMGTFQTRIVDWLLVELASEGFEGLTAGVLTFLGALDCGDNSASDLARTMRISRQAVHKQVKEAEMLGWLTTQAHPEKGNQRVIQFTPEGERMMSVARDRFAILDSQVRDQSGTDLAKITKFLASFDPAKKRA